MSDRKSNKTVVVVTYSGCIEFEILLAAELCNRKLNVKFATTDGRPHRGSSGVMLSPDFSLSDVDLQKCVGILVPGGDPYELIEGQGADAAKDFFSNTKIHPVVVGAICAGPAVLGKYGILKGRRFTHGYGDAHKEFLEPIWTGAKFTDRDLEVDGPIITAKPQAYVEFASEFARQVGAIESESRQAVLNSYYRNEKPFIDHVTIPVSNLEKSREFYGKVFESVGIKEAFGKEGVFWAYDLGTGLFEFRQADIGESVGCGHVAIRFRSKSNVEDFYQAAIECGAKDNGAPGMRPLYTPSYYAGFFLDPDGYNIEGLTELE